MGKLLPRDKSKDKEYPYYEIIKIMEDEFASVDNNGCPHWRQVAGTFDLMEVYVSNVWRAVGYFQNEEIAIKVRDALNNG